MISLNRIQQDEKVRQLIEFYNQVKDAHHNYFEYWLEHTFLHWEFWIAAFLTVFPWVLWGFLHKKESRIRLLAVGFYMIIITSWLDFLGTVMGLWVYTGNAIPTIPAFMPWDFSVFPVIIMLLLQYKPKVANWKKGLLFASGSAFIGEPLFIWLGLYVPLKWFPIISFPIYFVIFMIAAKIAHSKSYAPL